MQALKLLLIISIFIVFYNYVGYAIIVCALNKIKRITNPQKKDLSPFYPGVSFIVAAFNEEDCIEDKIINSLQQNYPPDRIEFIFITDGSSDRTASIVNSFPAVRLLHEPERAGKSAALNRAVKAAENEILIFSDANTTLNKDAVRHIAQHYYDRNVGGVAGEKKVISPDRKDEVGASEGLYWKYESFLKKIDSEFYSVAGAAGELFSLRKHLYEPISPEVILDDFVSSLTVARKGYRIIYEPGAFAMEAPSFSIEDEKKRKIRIAAGGFQAMSMLISLLYFWKHPRLSFLYISHRVLRWTLSPVCLIIAFFSNMILFFLPVHWLWKMLFIMQVGFYLLTFAGSFVKATSRFKSLKTFYYFIFMNISVIRGFFRFLKGKQPATWEKARRQTKQYS